MKRYLIAMLILSLSWSFSACALLGQEAELTGKELEITEYKAGYIRTSGYYSGAINPVVTAVSSVEELQEYHHENKDLYGFEGSGFSEAIEEKCLVLVLVEESSGSIRHEVTRITEKEGCRDQNSSYYSRVMY